MPPGVELECAVERSPVREGCDVPSGKTRALGKLPSGASYSAAVVSSM